MAKAISTRLEDDIVQKLEELAKEKGISRSKYIARILRDHAIGNGTVDKHGQKVLRTGHILICPRFNFSEPNKLKSRTVFVDSSVCETCNKKPHGEPCRSWEIYQCDLRHDPQLRQDKKNGYKQAETQQPKGE
jgi:hypothetical protein